MSNFDPIPVSIKQRLMAQLCEQIEDAIFVLDSNLRYLSVNASYELMIGYKESFWSVVHSVFTRLNFCQKKSSLS
ncbi:hypothetical protein [Psychrobacter sp. KH172YL61]|uniref:hypothetical protein n=1 Tax=Psychrobacter sp. KH172YL61 TaxID=2517899 RepID=UPI001F085EB7|nr:hypothetical protein [Psychrobacter sp. KH172YL61]